MQSTTSEQKPNFVAAIHREMLELLATPGCHALGVSGLGGSGKTTAVQKAAQIEPDKAIVFQTDW